MDPADWRYLAEGRLHVLIAYEGPRNGGSDGRKQGTETAYDDHRFRHHVLRLLKQRHPDADAAAASSPAALYDTAHDRAYLERVAGPLLGTQYVDVGWTVPLTLDFLQGVTTRIAPARPPGRSQYGLDLTATTAECLRDLTRFFPPLPPELPLRLLQSDGKEFADSALTVEIKPKAGYVSRSFLVAPEHRDLKRRLTRFQLMQRYRFQRKLTEAVEPEWGVLRRINLDYSPLDLFSGVPARMAASLCALLPNPQNFCQLFMDGRPCYGRGQEDPAAAREAIGRLLLSSPPLAPHDGDGVPFLALAHVLVGVLSQEPLLSRLWALQAMDALDVEGAALVFQRLAALCHGDEVVALARLVAAELEPLGSGEGDARLARLEAMVARPATRGLHPHGDATDGPAAAWRARHEEARAAVETLFEEDCVLLLRRWLVALGACDASIMVSLRRCETHQEEKEEEGAWGPQLQTGATAGLLRWSAPENNQSSHHAVPIAYYLQIVDMGPKPPTKVLAKAALEERIVALARRHLQSEEAEAPANGEEACVEGSK